MGRSSASGRSLTWAMGAAVGVALCAVPGIAGRIPDGGDELCGECKTSGRIANPWYSAHAAAERGSLHCSSCLLGDKVGRNSNFLPCPRCKRPDLKAKAEKELAEWKRVQEEWLAQRAALEQQLGTTLQWV